MTFLDQILFFVPQTLRTIPWERPLSILTANIKSKNLLTWESFTHYLRSMIIFTNSNMNWILFDECFLASEIVLVLRTLYFQLIFNNTYNCLGIILPQHSVNHAIPRQLLFIDIFSELQLLRRCDGDTNGWQIQFLGNYNFQILKQTIGQKSKKSFDIDANPMPSKTKMMPIVCALQEFLLKLMLSRNSKWLIFYKC